MLPVVTAAEMMRADSAAIDDLQVGAIRLMELAGARTSDLVRELIEKENISGSSFLVVCGKGNNGGDGLVLARHLLNHGAEVDILLLYPETDLSPINRNTLDTLCGYQALSGCLRIFHGHAEALPFVRDTHYEVLIDAILGTGLKLRRQLSSPLCEGIDLLNGIHDRAGSPLIALDIPSGLDATSGVAAERCVLADMTVSMAFLKTGFFFNDGPLHCGELRIADISIPEFLIAPSACRLTDKEYAAEHFILREPEGAKHQSGKVLIVAGSQSDNASMLGAAMLAVKAALKTGAGYVCAAIPIAAAGMLHSYAPEAVVIAQEMDAILEKAGWADAVLIGCGLGRDPKTVDFIRELLRKPEITGCKLVLDADALFALSGVALPASGIDFANTILTPHYGEFSRLCGHTADEIALNALVLATDFARLNRVNLLLKGHPTLIVGGEEGLMLNDSGTEALSTAGSGDILAGMIAAIAAKGAEILDAGAAAAWFHGRAGDLANDISSLVSANDILNAIPEAVQEIFSLEE